jgi:lipid-A-disaccharide synthase
VTLDKIAMVNIVAGKRIVPELIQGEAAPDRIVFEAERLLQNSDQYEEMVENLRAVRGMLSHGAVGKNCVKAIQSVITLC